MPWFFRGSAGFKYLASPLIIQAFPTPVSIDLPEVGAAGRKAARFCQVEMTKFRFAEQNWPSPEDGKDGVGLTCTAVLTRSWKAPKPFV